jgi:hypothetical protein
MAKSPESVTIRSYNVGFGDCFLLSFRYGPKTEKHVLIDFGSTGLPEGAPKSRMMDIARDIKARTGGRLDAVVATHRHKDHISGFATNKGGTGTGDVIRSLKPRVVVQPWTEDPTLATDATSPKMKKFGTGTARQIAALRYMHGVSALLLQELARTRSFSKPLREQLSFLGENNLANLSAVKNLMKMGPNSYVFCGAKSGLEKVLPGMKITVLGPPTVKQTDTIKKQRSNDPDEFWQFQANAARFAVSGNGGKPTLFPRYVRSHGPTFPLETRWLIYHSRVTRGEQLLSLVRMLDKAMNNTSVILLFQSKGKSLLFPGDAQIENWQFALDNKEFVKLLERVNLYKVGHHGSRNATPKSLWKLFKNRSTSATGKTRLLSLMSTMAGVHGHSVSTEVPRRTLVNALKRETSHFSTQMLKGKDFFHDVTMRL